MRFKKILAAVSAAVVMSAGTVCNVSAYSLLNCDVNNDGDVDISDTIAINMALIGEWQPTDKTTLDVNENGVVDELDKMCIECYVTSGQLPNITVVIEGGSTIQ